MRDLRYRYPGRYIAAWVALEVQQLQHNLTELESARRAAAAQLEQLRRLETVESVAQGELSLARVSVDHVLPDARRDAIAPLSHAPPEKPDAR